jgi:endonuclease/exonuclease/phosphatase family metal-dependent hydrolase
MPKSCNRIGALASLATMGALLATRAARPSRLVAVTAASAPVVAAAGVAIGVGLAFDRRRRIAGLTTAALGVAALSTQVPLRREASVAAVPPTLRVTSANILLGGGDATSLVAWAVQHTDVLVVQELTADAVARLTAAGIDGVFAHRMVDPRPRAAGIGVWSRHPIVETRHLEGPSMPCLAVRVRVPGCLVDPVVVAVHLESPVDIAGWRADLAVLPAVLREADTWAAGGAVVVAGDFNSTRDMRPFRDGLAGYVDAAAQAGVRYAATFPDSKRWMVPLFVIDHILTLRCAATEVRTAAILGSDHRALVASIDVGGASAPNAGP